MKLHKIDFRLNKNITLIMSILSKKDKIAFFSILTVQTLTASLDILGIFVVGILASLSSNYVLETNLNFITLSFINFFNLSNYPLKSIILFTSFLTLIFFVTKSIISMYLNWKIFIFYSKKQFEYSSNLYAKLLNASYSWLKKQNIEDVNMAIGAGSEAIFVKQIANLIMITSDAILVIFMLVFLTVYNFEVAFFTFIFLLIIAILLQKVIGAKASRYGTIKFENTMLQNSFVNMILLAFKEVFVLKKDDYFKNKFNKSLILGTTSGAKGLWIQQVPKYVFEIALVIGIFLLSLFLVASSVDNISILIVFIIGAGRLIPSFFRIQSGILGMKSSYSEAAQSISFFNNTQIRIDSDSKVTDEFLSHSPSIRIDSISFKFPDSNDYFLKDISIEIPSGEVIAFVGKSGSGKTTLADLILNIYTPNKGSITIKDGYKLVQPGTIKNISYITQSPIILNATVLENIAIGVDSKDINQEDLSYAINKTGLDDLIRKLPDGVHTRLNNLGGILSGGEKQRVAIARALYAKPKLLIIDEGTSSLDYTSEKFITNFLLSLEGNVTTIIIAHRINTVKNVKNIYFMDNGKILSAGSYEFLQKSIPEFNDWVQQLNSETIS
jgi:ABC-type multidrug transport system fused ATPase/permease subunit